MHLNFGTEGMAAVAKAPLYSKLIFCRVCGSNPAVDRNMSTIFFVQTFLHFFSYDIQRGECLNHVDTFLNLFDPLFLLYRIVSLRISKASLQCTPPPLQMKIQR